MKNYDFTQDLSPIDFELLSKDILEKLLAVKFENFRDGSDGGIDLRHCTIRRGSPRIIVQCKRYAPGSFSKLYAHLKEHELPKIARLGNIRYILCTSVSLSPQNVDALVALLEPHVQSPSDVYGRERLNAALAEHPDVERRHIKLWIGNVGLLESLIAPRGRFITDEELTKAAHSAKVYVHNESLTRAQMVLDKESLCVISGNPGIGKTTLAHMLMMSYAKRGFEIVKIESNIDEVRGTAFHEMPRFYFYDDFLGQNSRDQKLEKNEDQKIIDFIHSVRHSKRSVFVMTTRDYLLRQSQLVYEKLDRFNFSPLSCVIELKDYTAENRALIVYNHVAFSGIGTPHIDAFVKSRVYVTIMNHPNFNPRLIQFITDERVVGTVSAVAYPAFCIESLDNPAVIWRHAFQHQLSAAAQDVIICLATFGARIFLEDLRIAFERYHHHRCHRLNREIAPHAFATALKELAGNFVSVSGHGTGSLVEFHNPSIQDYALHEMADSRLYGDLIAAACFFEQAHWLSTTIGKATPQDPQSFTWMSTCMSRMEELIDSPIARLYFYRYHDGRLEGHRVQNDRVNRLGHLLEAAGSCTDFVRAHAERLVPRIAAGEFSVTAYSYLLTGLCTKGALEGELVAAVVSHLSAVEDMDIEAMHSASELCLLMRGALTEEQRESIVSSVMMNAETYANSIKTSDVDSPDTLRDDVHNLGRIAETLGVDLALQQETIEAKAQDLEERMRRKESDEDIGSGRYVAQPRAFSDRDADALFRTLGE